MPEKRKNKTAENLKNTQKKRRKLIESMVMTAIFTAMAVALKSVTKITVPLLGAGGMSVSFAGIFSFFPAILYGPLYGGASSAMCDFLGWLLKPDGPYNPAFTIVAFLGGCIKGVIWMGISKGAVNRKAVKGVLAGIFAFLLVVGCVFTVSLNSDGIMSGAVAVKEELPMKDKVTEAELSPISRFAVSLAKYNKDTLTLTGINNVKEGVSIVPSQLGSANDTLIGDITKVSADVFNTEGLGTLYIPGGLRIEVPKDFTLTNRDVVIVCFNPDGSLEDFAKEYNVRLVDNDSQYDYISTKVDNYSVISTNGFYTVKSSDTYRKYLAGYLNFMTLGFIASGSLGLIIMLVYFILSKVGSLKNNEKVGIYLHVLPTVLTSGLVVTTVNTFILLETVLNYQGRSFWLFYAPRFAEEILVSVIQAYVITLLITALSANKSLSKMLGLSGSTGK